MELSIKTLELQEMVDKVGTCVSNNKLIPLTSLLSIGVKDKHLVLTATDATNYFYSLSKSEVDCEDFEIAVIADLFIKLIQKMTSENITITVDESVKVKGNGNYTLALILDENGGNIKFPKKFSLDEFRNDGGTLKLTTINTILNYNKPSLATSLSLPALTMYYCGDKVITSDRSKMCSTQVKTFDKPYLISAKLMELLSKMSDEDIMVLTTDKDLIFRTSNELIYSPIADGIETFPVKVLDDLSTSAFPSTCKVSRSAVVEVLDRLALFVSAYDKKVITLTFTRDGIMFSSKNSDGVELIPYISSTDFKDYQCSLDVEMLKSQIATQSEDAIEIAYGSEVAVKLILNNVIQIIALAEE
ncbi:MAG: hypothetical protein IKP50_00260 [Bacilli bacterium]|nr:hypothetical protein [Bacilli bacterium]